MDWCFFVFVRLTAIVSRALNEWAESAEISVNKLGFYLFPSVLAFIIVFE